MIAVPLQKETQNPNDALDQRERNKSNAGERLDSWKEIAAYLRRSVRCVQRWERTEGLPILRHQHAKGATVYAYRQEVDQWWQKRGQMFLDRSWPSLGMTCLEPFKSLARDLRARLATRRPANYGRRQGQRAGLQAKRGSPDLVPEMFGAGGTGSDSPLKEAIRTF